MLENIHQNLVNLIGSSTKQLLPLLCNPTIFMSSSRYSTNTAIIKRILTRYSFHSDYYKDMTHQYSLWSLTEQLKACWFELFESLIEREMFGFRNYLKSSPKRSPMLIGVSSEKAGGAHHRNYKT